MSESPLKPATPVRRSRGRFVASGPKGGEDRAGCAAKPGVVGRTRTLHPPLSIQETYPYMSLVAAGVKSSLWGWGHWLLGGFCRVRTSRDGRLL